MCVCIHNILFNNFISWGKKCRLLFQVNDVYVLLKFILSYCVDYIRYNLVFQTIVIGRQLL